MVGRLAGADVCNKSLCPMRPSKPRLDAPVVVKWPSDFRRLSWAVLEPLVVQVLRHGTFTITSQISITKCTRHANQLAEQLQ
jgi:hypothetical protein